MYTVQSPTMKKNTKTPEMWNKNKQGPQIKNGLYCRQDFPIGNPHVDLGSRVKDSPANIVEYGLGVIHTTQSYTYAPQTRLYDSMGVGSGVHPKYNV